MSEENENVLTEGTADAAAADTSVDTDSENKTDVPAVPAGNIGAADRLSVYRVSILWVTLIAVAVRLAALFTSYDSEIGYFNQKNFFPDFFDALLVLMTLFAVSSVFLFRKQCDMPTSPAFGGGAEFFTELYAGFIFIADAAYKVYRFVGICRSGKIETIIDRFKNPKYYQSPADTTMRVLAILFLMGFISSVLASVYFLRGGGGKNKKGQIGLVYFVIIRCLSGMVQVYFNMEIPMNNPGKLLCELSMISVMIYFLAEERFNIGGLRARPNFFIGASLAAFPLCTIAGITSVVGLLTGVAPYGEFCVEGVIALVCGLYAFVRLTAYERIVRSPQPAADVTENVTDTDTETVSAFGSAETNGNDENDENEENVSEN